MNPLKRLWAALHRAADAVTAFAELFEQAVPSDAERRLAADAANVRRLAAEGNGAAAEKAARKGGRNG
jgi:hypothetical protein